MKSIPVIPAHSRANWVIRDPEEYFAFVRWEANQLANNRTATVHEWRQSLIGRREIVRREIRKSNKQINRWYLRLWRKFTR